LQYWAIPTRSAQGKNIYKNEQFVLGWRKGDCHVMELDREVTVVTRVRFGFDPRAFVAGHLTQDPVLPWGITCIGAEVG
jgi:hypothetical protein